MQRSYAKRSSLYPLFQLVNLLSDGIRIYSSSMCFIQTKRVTLEDGIYGKGILQWIMCAPQIVFHVEYIGIHLSDSGPCFCLDAIRFEIDVLWNSVIYVWWLWSDTTCSYIIGISGDGLQLQDVLLHILHSSNQLVDFVRLYANLLLHCRQSLLLADQTFQSNVYKQFNLFQ